MLYTLETWFVSGQGRLVLISDSFWERMGSEGSSGSVGNEVHENGGGSPWLLAWASL